MSTNHDDLKLLLGGYATGTLTPAEREKLFAAALENQEIFDALADDQALKELLEDPESRGYLREALHETTSRPLEEQPHLMRMSVAAAAAAPMPRPPSTFAAAPPPRSGFRSAYLALAAVIVISTSVGAWFYLRAPEQKQVASVATNSPIQPKPQVEMAKAPPPQEFRDRREAPRQAAAQASSAEPAKAKDRSRDEVRDQVAPASPPPPPPAPSPVAEPTPAPVVVAAEAEAKAVAAAAPKPAAPAQPPAFSLRRRNAQGQFVDIPTDSRLTEGDEIEIILPIAAGAAGTGAGGARQEVAELADVASPKKEAFANRTNALGSLARSDRAKAAPAPAPAAAAAAPPPPTPPNRFTLKAGENVLRYAGREIRLQAAPKNP